jgi:hypothetical protein
MKLALCIVLRIGSSKFNREGIAGTVMPWQAAH